MPSWQRAGPHRPFREAIFDQKRHDTNCPPPILTGSSPLWFLFVPQIQKEYERKAFATVEEVKQKSLEGLKDIPMSEFKNCFEQWKNRLEKCVVVNGEYFEGD